MELTLQLISSGEFEPWTRADDLLARADRRRSDGGVVIVPTAQLPAGDEAFVATGTQGARHLEALGATVHVLPLKTRADSFRDDVVAEISSASLIYLTGGYPAYLAETLRHTPAWREVLRVLDAGAVLVACSAGTWVLGELAPDSTASVLADHRWVPGLALVPSTVIAAHWDRLDSFIPGLRDRVRSRVQEEGFDLIAIDERTAIRGDGRSWEVFGSATVTVISDGEALVVREGDRFALPPRSSR